MALLIKNGTIVTSTDSWKSDIYCEQGVIQRIAPSIEPPEGTSATVVDATGTFVFPGFIDPHVHIYLPFMGTFAKDDHTSASVAALVGGTTTLIEMICPSRQEEPLEALEVWQSKALGKSACDYTFHLGVTRMDDEVADQLRQAVERGIASFKIFLAYKGALGIDDTELYRTLNLAKSMGVIVTAHCENETAIYEKQQELLAVRKTGPQYHEPSRPTLVEAEGVHHLMTFAELTGAHVYVVHTSCDEALQAALAARYRGVHVWIETVVPHLVLDNTYAEREAFEGAKYVMSPPLRDKRHQHILWNAIRSRLVSTVATDHAPFDFSGQKTIGRDDFTKIPNGIPSVENRVDLLYTYGVVPGRIDLQTLVDAASTQAARLFGLYPRKGTIQVGSDADLVVFDPDWQGTISAETQAMRVDYSAFEGWPLQGRPSLVAVRGDVQVRDGKFVGRTDHGQMLCREPTHF